MVQSNTINELQAELGQRLRSLRLNLNVDQRTLAGRAGISEGAVKNIENGKGATLKTLIAVLRVLGREDWLATIAPMATVNPLDVLRDSATRQRAKRKTKVITTARSDGL